MFGQFTGRGPTPLGGLSGEAELQRVINAKVKGFVEGRKPMASFPSKPTNVKPEYDWQLWNVALVCDLYSQPK